MNNYNPDRHFKAFIASPLLSWEFSLLLSARYLFGNPLRLMRSLGVLVLCALAGLAIAALSAFPPSWPLFLCFAVVPVLAGAVGSVFVNRRRSFEFYRPGSTSRVLVITPTLYLDLNGKKFIRTASEAVRLRHMASIEVLVFTDDTMLVFPAGSIPSSNFVPSGAPTKTIWP